MEKVYEQEQLELEKVTTSIPDKISFLNLQKVFAQMLKDIAIYADFLKLFIERFGAFNEVLRIEAKYLLKDDVEKDKIKEQRHPIIYNDPKTIRDLDGPLHCAVRQLNEHFIKWLLKNRKTEVNLRNENRETALAILCKMFDWYKQRKPKLEKEIQRKKEEMQSAIRKIDDERKLKKTLVKLNNKIEGLIKEMSVLEKDTPTYLPKTISQVKFLLQNGADFNIYVNDCGND
ncbi:AGAP001011-PA-like protein [Anopheles sinensis]|uniref:AGAP001011-PA-like protein n=1 Tax=Anopheles sinensis TaxID=74873 RepID=A0A084VMK8_ANOSI|nr:AGAP001011-PA-like protein [Anopheles sinensis]